MQSQPRRVARSRNLGVEVLEDRQLLSGPGFFVHGAVGVPTFSGGPTESAPFPFSEPVDFVREIHAETVPVAEPTAMVSGPIGPAPVIVANRELIAIPAIAEATSTSGFKVLDREPIVIRSVGGYANPLTPAPGPSEFTQAITLAVARGGIDAVNYGGGDASVTALSTAPGPFTFTDRGAHDNEDAIHTLPLLFPPGPPWGRTLIMKMISGNPGSGSADEADLLAVSASASNMSAPRDAAPPLPLENLSLTEVQVSAAALAARGHDDSRPAVFWETKASLAFGSSDSRGTVPTGNGLGPARPGISGATDPFPGGPASLLPPSFVPPRADDPSARASIAAPRGVEMSGPALLQGSRGAGLLASFSPFDQATVEQALDRFLVRLDDLDRELLGLGESTNVLPWVMTSAALLSAAELARRRVRDSWDEESGLPGGEEDPSLLGLPGLPGRWDSAEA